MIVTAEVNVRSAARALRACGYAVALPANLDREVPKRIDLQAIVTDEDAADRLDWAWDEPEPAAIDTDALRDLVAACLAGDLAIARALAPSAFDQERAVLAVEQALQPMWRAA